MRRSRAVFLFHFHTENGFNIKIRQIDLPKANSESYSRCDRICDELRAISTAQYLNHISTTNWKWNGTCLRSCVVTKLFGLSLQVKRRGADGPG
jgi:hypothetical protein